MNTARLLDIRIGKGLYAKLGHADKTARFVHAGGGDRTFKLHSGTTSEYGRYVKSLGDPVTGRPTRRCRLASLAPGLVGATWYPGSYPAVRGAVAVTARS